MTTHKVPSHWLTPYSTTLPLSMTYIKPNPIKHRTRLWIFVRSSGANLKQVRHHLCFNVFLRRCASDQKQLFVCFSIHSQVHSQFLTWNQRVLIQPISKHSLRNTTCNPLLHYLKTPTRQITGSTTTCPQNPNLTTKFNFFTSN